MQLSDKSIYYIVGHEFWILPYFIGLDIDFLCYIYSHIYNFTTILCCKNKLICASRLFIHFLDLI